MNEFRLHFNESIEVKDDELNETVTPPHTQQAIADCAAFNSTTQWWSELEVIPNCIGSQPPIVRLRFGRILSDGEKETAIATKEYLLLENDVVKVVNFTHV